MDRDLSSEAGQTELSATLGLPRAQEVRSPLSGLQSPGLWPARPLLLHTQGELPSGLTLCSSLSSPPSSEWPRRPVVPREASQEAPAGTSVSIHLLPPHCVNAEKISQE